MKFFTKWRFVVLSSDATKVLGPSKEAKDMLGLALSLSRELALSLAAPT